MSARYPVWIWDKNIQSTKPDIRKADGEYLADIRWKPADIKRRDLQICNITTYILQCLPSYFPFNS